MARRPKGSVPSYCLHKQSGQACFHWPLGGGKYRTILLGKHGSDESHKEYQRVLQEWKASFPGLAPQPCSVVPDLTVAELLLRFWQHAEQHYRLADGRPSRELEHYQLALKPLLDLYGDQPAGEFGPLALKAVRQKLLDARQYQVRHLDRKKAKARWVGEDHVNTADNQALLEKQWVAVEILQSRKALSRKVINQRIDHVRRVFKWAASEQLVDHSVYQALTTVTGLRRGQPGTRDRAPVRAVGDEVVAATLPFLRGPVRAMVQIQRLCGARPSEICQMRLRDIDRSGEIWWYRIDPNDIPREGPANLHKSAHHEDAAGHATVKLLPLGPKAQALLLPFLDNRDRDAFLFCPAEACAELKQSKRENRQTPLWPSHLKAQEQKRQPRRARAPRDHYDRHSYAHAVARAAAKADFHAHKLHLEIPAEQRIIPHWHPHQLRHAAATEIRRLHGAEAAQVYIGHSKLSTTEIYAEKNLKQIEEIARQIG